ncbi:hypothetical protein [Thermostaphylospora chromogena]|uniref:Uncharacterized protein n=1 Tax=Thermostaphylospora chromogena TaxID=35622 RepID=A0A1H1HJL1_9ACTN|nr:hypothetical protein [Thermostaphylospora chromogena]SDR25622.1 hypothetical protein SAMN04489764_4514 [Thermostaphylospora chromogena]
MSERILLATAVAGALAAPVLVHSPPVVAAEGVEIGSITMRPANPVVGAEKAVHMVIDVTVRGVKGRDGVTITVEPGGPGRAGTTRQTGRADGSGGEKKPEETLGRDPGRVPPPAGRDPLPPGRVPPQEPVRHGDDGTDPYMIVDARPAAPSGRTSASRTHTGTAREDVARPQPRPRYQSGPPARPRYQVPPARPLYRIGTAPRGGSAAEPAHRKPVTYTGRPVETRNGWEVWRFLPTEGLDRWHPAGRWTVTAVATGREGDTAVSHAAFHLRRETRFEGLTVRRTDDGVRVSGALKRLTARLDTDFAGYPDRRVQILHRDPDGVQWTRMADAVTGKGGRFTRTLYQRLDGDIRVRFGGTGRYAAETSAVQPIA